MTVKEKLQFFSDHGMSVSYIARAMKVDVSTLTKWLRGEKGITHKNEARVLETLREITDNFYEIVEE